MPANNLQMGGLASGANSTKFDPNSIAGATRYTNALAANIKVTALNQTTGSIPANIITGADEVYCTSTNATPGAQLVRSAANMMADSGMPVGSKQMLRISNTGAGTLTLTTDAGATVTLVGTMTIATNTFRDFILEFLTATTATITAVGTGTA